MEPGLTIKSVWKEPILHFLLIGVAIFVVYGLVAPHGKDTARIVVSQAMVDNMIREHQAR